MGSLKLFLKVQMTGTHSRVHVTDCMWVIATHLWTNSTSAGFTWSRVCVIVLTFQYTACLFQRLSPCPLWGRHVERVIEWLLVYCLKKTVRKFMVGDGSLITSVCVTKSCLHVSLPAQWVSEGKSTLWKQASHRFSVTDPALFVLEMLDVFLRARTGEYSSLWNQSAGRSQVIAISALQRDISRIQKLPQPLFGGFYTVASFELRFWICLLQSWLRFYSTVWEMSTTTISSKCLGSSTFEWDGSYCLKNSLLTWLVIICTEFICRIYLFYQQAVLL